MLFRSSLFFLVWFFALQPVRSQEKVGIDSSFANSHYRMRLAFFRQMPDSKKEIIFLGNSITEAGEWQEMIRGKNVKNRGISGDVTYGVLARLDEVLSARPAKIFLLIGINDMKRGIPVDTIACNYQRIVEKIRATSPKTKLYIQSVLPVHESMLAPSYKNLKNDLIVALNQRLEETAKQVACTYVNLHAVMRDEAGQLAKEYTTDGIHLRPSTYIRWVQYLKDQNYL
ncbi:MAG TPA: GDSL-type esterase/lipase family protein [Flavisolibacter sp.]|jgi:lysophospholipase L1-like esterase|nr:GDSL-type esterase/lipase family protein [Flavisolibacter sp.]